MLDNYKELTYTVAEEEDHTAFLPEDLKELDELETLLINQLNN